MWGPYIQTFFRTAEESLRESGLNAMFFWEMLVDPTNVPLGYRFFLSSVGASKTDIINTMGNKTISHYREATLRAHPVRGEPDKEAIKFLARVKEDGPHPDEMWRVIQNEREWKRVVETCTGVTSPVRFCGFKDAYSLERAFIALPAETCDAQQTLAPEDDINGSAAAAYMFDDPGGARVLHWPRPELVYRVPHDCISVAGLHSKLFPHIQVERDLLEHRALVLVPMLVASITEPATAEIVVDEMDVDTRAKRRRTGIMQRISCGAFAESTGAVNDTTELRKLLRKVPNSGLDRAEQRENVTPYQPLLRIAKQNDSVINKLSTQSDAPQRGDIVFLDGSGGQTSWGQVVRNTNSKMKRTLQLVVRESLLELFVTSCITSPRRSPGASLIHDAIIRKNYFDTTGRKAYYQRTQKQLSPVQNMVHKFFASMEIIEFINQVHDLVNLAEVSRHDAFRGKTDMRFNILAASENGATSKSTAFKVVRSLSIPHVIVSRTYATMATNFVEGDDNGVNNFCDQVDYDDECDPAIFDQSQGGTSTRESRAKAERTDAEKSCETIRMNKEGRRIKYMTFLLSTACHWACFNMSSNKISDAMFRRYFFRAMSEDPSMKRFMARVMGQEMRAPAQMAELRAELEDIYMQKHSLTFAIEKLICSGALPDVSMHGHSLLIDLLLEKLARLPHFSQPNPSVIERLRIVSRHRAMTAAYIDTFFHPDRPEGPFEWKDFMRLSRRLFVGVEHTVMAIGDLFLELFPPMMLGVRRAIHHIYDRECTRIATKQGGHGFEELFACEHGSQDRASVGRYDFTYMSFQKPTLLRRIAAIIPTFMGGFRPSEAAINTVLDRFEKRNVPNSHTMEMVEGKVELRPDLTVKPDTLPLARTAPGTGLTMRYEIQSAFVFDIDASTTDASVEALNILRGCVAEIMSARYQLPRRMTMGQSEGAPWKLESFATKGSDNAMAITIEKAINPTPELRGRIPEYDVQIGTHDNADCEILQVDMDVYALAMHDSANHVGVGSIPSRFRDVLRTSTHADQRAQDAATDVCAHKNEDKRIETCCCGDKTCTNIGHGNVQCECFFAGKPIAQVSPDKQREWALAHAHSVKDQLVGLETDIDDDVDFEEVRHTRHWEYLRTRDGQRRFPARAFGFLEWDATDTGLKTQYKLIAFHPLIRQHYWSVAENAADNNNMTD